jgi:predicted ester cyclase
MSSEDNKALIRDWLTGVDTGKAEVIDDFLSGEVVDHNPPPFQGPATGIAGARDAFNYALGAFSDFKHEIVAQFADGDYVISRIVGRGRHTGDFMGVPATGKDVTMEGIAIHRVVDGRIVEHWAQVDAANMLMQMGAIPASG